LFFIPFSQPVGALQPPQLWPPFCVLVVGRRF